MDCQFVSTDHEIGGEVNSRMDKSEILTRTIPLNEAGLLGALSRIICDENLCWSVSMSSPL